MKLSFILTLLCIMLSCSSNSDDNDNEQIALPKSILLSYNNGQQVSYAFDYNSKNQIEDLVVERGFDDDITTLESHFNYNEEGELIGVVSNASNEVYTVNFSYGDNSVITNVDFLIDGVETHDIDMFYHGVIPNSYAANSEWASFPMAWDFDEQNRLTEYLITTINYVPGYSNFDKGIFHDVNLQPANHIWQGLVFYLVPWELYFFSEYDIENLTIEDDTYFYKDKLWDGDGNLIAFQFTPQVPFGFTIHYTITYEKKTL